MKKKRLTKYIYEGLGFPIELVNVEMIWIDDGWYPKINVRQIATKVIKMLPFQQERLTGSQIFFVRSYLGMSLRRFAKEVVKESHMAVAKWEQFGQQSTRMDSNTEIMLRLYLYEKVCVKTEQEKKTFFKNYQKIRDVELLKSGPTVSVKAA